MRCELLLLVLVSTLAPARGAAAEKFSWHSDRPAAQGMSAARLEALKESLAQKRTKALLVVRNDRIVYEWYAADHGPDKTHYTASMAKAIVGGLSLAVAMTDGRIALEDRAARYVPQWKNDSRKSQITIEQLGSHTSGLEDAEADGLPHEKLAGWKGDFWKRLDPPADAFTISRDVTPLLFEPGSASQYSNRAIAMLSYVVTAAIQDGPHKDIRTLLRERVMRPIGASDDEWSVGYNKTYTVDGLPLVASWGGGNYTARTVARVGRLMLRQGDWDGTQLISREAIRRTTADAATPGNGGMGWWTNSSGLYPRLPEDAFWGAGAGHQVLLVVPSLKLIAVRNGAALGEGEQYRSAMNQHFFEPLLACLNADAASAANAPPYPPGRHITAITWAPKDTIVRQAKGGDNWPLTWADDDALYTAYGDGWGFEPLLPKKLSMGLAKVTGSPPGQGINLRSATVESSGDGEHGHKASGMLMVDGVLYLLARNTGNARLAWSADRGASWTWADWKFTTSFGCPTFLNFGRNYAGARDDFVYVYSQDHDSAYQPADRMVLARVSKDRIREQGAYEYFQALDSAGQPVWTKSIAERGAVFSYPGNCYRSGITYNAGLKRYLWCQILPHSTHPQGMRFQGGFGIYDAPEPWGPWTTVFHAPEWDVGPGETSSFPSKWMSADGKTVHLVFSGDDYFSVRAATLSTRSFP